MARKYTVNPERKPGPKPSTTRKTPVLTYLTEPIHATFEEAVNRRGMTKTEAFEQAVKMWLKSNG